MLMTSLISRFDLIEITYEGDDDFPQRTATSMTSDLEGGGDEEVALGTREGIEMEMDDFSTSIIPTTTTWSGGNNVASMMSSLNLSEINEESTDENGGLARSTSCDVGGGGGYANNARKKVLSKMTDDDDECTLEVVGTTSCNGRTAMVSLSMSEIESEDDNDDDYDDDDDNDDETPAVEGEECGIFGHSSSHRSVAAIAFSGPRGNISDTSIFVCIAEEVPRLASAPQCNEGLAIERVNINEMDECTGKKDVCITEEIPCLGSENIERGVVDEMDDGCMREVGVVSDITTTRSAAKNPFDSAKVWSENDGIVVKASIRNEFLTGESNAGVDIMDDERERHCEIQMDEVYDISTSGETAVEHVAWDINVGFTANMEGLYRDDDTNISGRIVGEFSCSVQRSPSFGSMSSNDASADCSQSSHSEEEDVLAGRNEYLTMNQPIINRPRRATSLSECLAVVQDYLLDSSDTKSEVVEVPSLNDPFARLFTHDRNFDVVEETSPRDQLIFKYPCHAGAADEETSQTSDVDSDDSQKTKLEQTKSELNILIDEISALEDAAQIQHEYITSPTKGDFRTQLDHINDQIDWITPISKLHRNNGLTEEGSASQLLPTVVPYHFRDRQKASPTTSRTTAQKLYFFKQPVNSVSSTRTKRHSLPEVQEPQKTNTSLILPSHKKLAVIPRTVKTPHIDRLEHIASIREKHQIFTDPMDMISPHDVSEKVSKDCDDQSPTCGRPSVSGMISPTMKLIDLPNSTKATARKCYFYKSPRSDKTTMTGSVRTENRPAPHPSEMDKETLSSDDGARREGRITFATPSFSPREAMALRKHVIGIREKKKNGGDGDGVGDFLALEKDVGVVRRRGFGERRNGSSTPASPRPFETTMTPTLTPREARAYEKHLTLRGVRERPKNSKGGRTPPTTTGGQYLFDAGSKDKAESAYDRHVMRIQGRPSTA
ncbi:hypothetical protein ACHAXA_002400 [Cyclostephanos tholiformis]|uniref:Uncharacterized protein n=1 Tax=Cyclostephanos tholiformis TaxID=382380 RepID=A0ABD3RD93_9STRA